jgi:hypothetical protein
MHFFGRRGRKFENDIDGDGHLLLQAGPAPSEVMI